MKPVDPVFSAPSTPDAQTLRIVVVAPESLSPDASNDHAIQEAERSRQLRIGLLENGYNLYTRQVHVEKLSA